MPTQEQIIDAIKKVMDPDLWIDIWTLGLIYDIKIEGNRVGVTMTFTSVMCPAGPMLVNQVKERVRELEEVEDVDVQVVFNPPWEPSEELKAMMGIL